MKPKYLFALLILGGALLGGYSIYTQTLEVEKLEQEEQKVPTVTYTLEEVAQHNSKEDCWQVIDGIVYDFTPYLASGDHPGGNAMARDCGTDSTFRYENDPKHSDYAKSLLPEFAIGVFAEEEGASADQAESES